MHNIMEKWNKRENAQNYGEMIQKKKDICKKA